MGDKVRTVPAVEARKIVGGMERVTLRSIRDFRMTALIKIGDELVVTGERAERLLHAQPRHFVALIPEKRKHRPAVDRTTMTEAEETT